MSAAIDTPIDLRAITIEGYKRADGQVGIRNRLLILFTVVCAEEIARRIAWQLDDAVVAGWRDCMVYDDTAQRKMIRAAQNPNVAGVLVVSLGCEWTDGAAIADAIETSGKPAATLSIQEVGGTKKAIAKGVELGRALLEREVERTTIPFRDLIIGVECGGSDTTSGIAANPAVGIAADRIVANGGTVLFEETNELLGCEHALSNRAANEDVRMEILAAIGVAREWGDRTDQRAISAGNIEGGLTTIEEKSLGAVCKAGTSPVVGVLHGGRWQRPIEPGLHLLAPWYVEKDGWTGAGTISDPNGVTELACCGAHIVLFTTGRGTVTGSGLAPVVKICGNPETYARMSDNMDIDAGAIVEGRTSIEDVGEEILAAVVATAQGALTRAEDLGHFEFHI